MGLINEFKQFAMRGNVVDLAVGVIIGAAFGKVVSSLVDEIMMPMIGLATRGIDFSSMYIDLSGKAAGMSYPDAKKAGLAVLGYGSLINAIIYFIIVAFCLFMVIKAMNRAMPKPPPPAPAGPTTDQKLLTEIRDLLAARRA